MLQSKGKVCTTFVILIVMVTTLFICCENLLCRQFTLFWNRFIRIYWWKYLEQFYQHANYGILLVMSHILIKCISISCTTDKVFWSEEENAYLGVVFNSIFNIFSKIKKNSLSDSIFPYYSIHWYLLLSFWGILQSCLYRLMWFHNLQLKKRQDKPNEETIIRDCCKFKGSCTLFRPYMNITTRISSLSFVRVSTRQLAASSLSKGNSSTLHFHKNIGNDGTYLHRAVSKFFSQLTWRASGRHELAAKLVKLPAWLIVVSDSTHYSYQPTELVRLKSCQPKAKFTRLRPAGGY